MALLTPDVSDGELRKLRRKFKIKPSDLVVVLGIFGLVGIYLMFFRVGNLNLPKGCHILQVEPDYGGNNFDFSCPSTMSHRLVYKQILDLNPSDTPALTITEENDSWVRDCGKEKSLLTVWFDPERGHFRAMDLENEN